MRRHLPRLVAVALVAALTWWLFTRGSQPEKQGGIVDREPAAESAPPSLRGLPPSSASLDAAGPDGAGTSRSVDSGAAAQAARGPRVDCTVRDAETGRELPVWMRVIVARNLGRLTFSLSRGAPPGYRAWDRWFWHTPELPWVTRYTVEYPLRRAVRAEFAVRRADGEAPREPEVSWHGFGNGTTYRRSAKSSPVRFDDIPHFPGAYIHLRATDGDAEGTARVRIPLRSEDVLHAEIEVVSDTIVDIPFEVFDDTVEHDNDLPYEESLGSDVPPPPPPGSVDVSVLHRNGTPAAGVKVRLDITAATTDARGVVRFEDVEPGDHEVTLVQPGMVPMRMPVYVRSGRVENVRLAESVGATLDVTVVSLKGEPLSFADVTIHQASGVTWLDVDGDVQRLDGFTDERGYRRFEHVEPGEVVLVTKWAGLVAKTKVKAMDGEVLPVRVVIARIP